MPHIQEIPATEIHWGHLRFYGRRIGTNGDANAKREWGVIYGPFLSEADAANWPQTQPIGPTVDVKVKGALVDRFFWDESLGQSGQYSQSEAQVGALLEWLAQANPSPSDYALTEGLDGFRSALLGASLYGVWEVLPLPTERAEEVPSE